VRPAGTVLSFLAPERPFDADVVRSFCHFVHFFASEQAAGEWTARHPETFALSLEQGFTLGKRTPSRLGPWKPAMRSGRSSSPYSTR
jgi:alkylmercury lyase